MIIVPRIDALKAKLRKLEDSSGFVILDDGTKFKPRHSGISLYVNSLRLERDIGHEPMLFDFPEQEQDQWLCYSKWHPDPGEHGALAVLLSNLARELVTRSTNEV